ncbi:hypothetical protein HanIR_Chr06g0282891 [Helianthus annuus]|nr:hypothetical protein HanIR_Chr06g0282891 [Helianthus annuus]
MVWYLFSQSLATYTCPLTLISIERESVNHVQREKRKEGSRPRPPAGHPNPTIVGLAMEAARCKSGHRTGG